jgi:alpha-tubulin suppressor-like RCC1 family protein
MKSPKMLTILVLVATAVVLVGLGKEASAGSLVGWGSDVSGQATPLAGNDFIAIAAGGYHSLALKADGSIVGWGSDDLGQAAPPEGYDFIAIAAGYNH